MRFCRARLLAFVFAAFSSAPCAAWGSSVAAQIGWLDGCLALPNDAIEPGALATFLLFDPDRADGAVPPALLVPGTILRKALPNAGCVLPSVELNGTESALTLYEVSLERIRNPLRAKGIGLLGTGPDPDVGFDFDRNGVPDSFGLCRSAEGLQVDLWSDRPGQVDRLWSSVLRSPRRSEAAPCERMELFYLPLGPLDAQVGYIEECLAIKDPTLEPGAPVTIMAPENGSEEDYDGQLTRSFAGTIRRKLDTDEHCPPLFEDRRSVNEWDGFSFYEIALDDGPFMNPEDTMFGIGIVGIARAAEQPIDLDDNGAPDSFDTCTSLEGQHYRVWPGARRVGEPIWRAYFYFGYEVEGPSDC